MMKNKNLQIYTFISLTTFGFSIYAGYFSLFLIKINTNPVIISMLIGSTALTSLFWGPIAGRIIDRSHYKYIILMISQFLCGSSVLLFGVMNNFSIIITPILVISFSLSMNLSVIIINQYILPILNDNYEKCIAISSRITGFVVFIAGVFLSIYYNILHTTTFFWISSICYLLSSSLVVSIVDIKKEAHPSADTPHKKNTGIYKETFKLIQKNWFLSLSMCTLAFAETSFNTNFDVVAFSLNTTPYSIVFLMGAISGALDSIASSLYPFILSKKNNSFKYNFLLSLFLFSFFIFSVAYFIGYGSKPLFLPLLSITIGLIGVWWSIFISGLVRSISDNNSYGQTMAAFRVPRSLITFLGVTSIGVAIQGGRIDSILLINTSLLLLLIVIKMFFSKN